MRRVIFEQMGQGLDIGEIIDRYNLYRCLVLQRTKGHPAYPAESINCNSHILDLCV